MKNYFQKFAAAIAMGGSLALAGSGVAVAADGEEKKAPQIEGLYVLTVSTDDGRSFNEVLVCPADLSTHPSATTACEQLARAKGDIGRIPARGGVCTMEYVPADFDAIGVWKGKLHLYSDTFSNPCVGLNETGGAVFDFM
ncbi:SSI family serine proteinase inhibitor [Salininema proteolyticum]|uniref:SSI family serine proteinase inhibitor n=1 Tax=Salininema proteolyticum TaxID=1607685 RepID=A0ABV8U5P0_9ACTN